jgi:hypothetical protein
MDPIRRKLWFVGEGKLEQANLASNPYRIPISWQKQALGFGP